MTIDVEVLAKVIGYIATIAGAFIGMYRAMKYCLSKYVNGKLETLEKWTRRQQSDIDDAAERDALLMKAQLASLEAIHQGKNNGNVDKAIADLQQYMLKNANKPISYAKK